MQGVISQFAIPVLESQTVWVSGSPTSIAYMNTQDMARFAVAALDHAETVRQAYPVVGPKAWNSGEVVQLCERAADKSARVFRVPSFIMRFTEGMCSFFEPAVNVAERLAFAEVVGSGGSMDAPMEETCQSFGIDPGEITHLEDYIQEYYDTILKRLRAMEADLDKDAKKKLPF